MPLVRGLYLNIMKNIVIPKDRIKEFTQRVDKRNMIQPIQIKDGTYVLPIEVLNIRSMVTKGIAQDIRDSLNRLPIIELTKEDFPKKECRLHLIDIPVYASIIDGIPKPKDETQKVKWFKSNEIKKMKLAYNHNEILKGEGLI